MPGKRYDRQFELSAARLVLEGEIPAKGPSDQPMDWDNIRAVPRPRKAGCGIWADGEGAFPGSGNPVASKDYEIPKLKKENGGSARRPRY